MKSKIAIAVLIVLAIAGTLAGIKVSQIKKMIAVAQSAGEPPVAVSSYIVREEKWQETLTSIGSVTAVQGVTVTPEIGGLIREISFESGSVVNKGDVLVRLDTSVEEAQLKALEAQGALAQVTLGREKALRTDSMNSQAELDAADAALKQSQANADAIRATIAKKTIRAPFSGRLGIRQVNLGQYLDPGKPIVSLQSLAPIHADFSLPQADLARITNNLRVRLTTDAYPDRQFDGTLTAANPEIDSDTRSVLLQATFDNPDQTLRPGMYARIEVLLPVEHTVTVVPATAVLSAPYGDSVYVIEKHNGTNGAENLTVRQQFIRSGTARGDFLSIESGLKPGDRIVGSGLFRLRNEAAVIENNTLVPKSETSPHPADS